MTRSSRFSGSPALRVARLACAFGLLLHVVPCTGAPESPVVSANPNATDAQARPAIPLRDQRLDPSEPVFGILVASEPRAYTVADLRRAPPLVHDMVGDRRIDLAFADGAARLVRGAPDIRSVGITTWAAWAGAHPDTSLWRRAASAESGEPRDPGAVRVVESRDYRTVLGCTFGCEAVAGDLSSTPAEHPGVLVISGAIENASSTAVHHVVLRYELLDDAGRVVYRDEGFNRSAETLAETEAAAPLAAPPPIAPIAPGRRESFRMILLNEELPAFRSVRVGVARVY